MSKSLDEIYRQIEIERQRRAAQVQQEERRAWEMRESQRQKYLEKTRMFETAFNPSSAASSSSAGAGGKKPSIDIPNNNTTGSSVFYNVKYNNEHKGIIHNFDTDITTDIISFGLSQNDNWYYDRTVAATNKGFFVSFENEVERKIFLLDLSGEIIYQKVVSSYSTSWYDRYLNIRYQEGDVYYLLVYDGLIRTFEFNNEINLGSSQHDNISSEGFIVTEYIGNGPDSVNVWFIKDGLDSKILIKNYPTTGSGYGWFSTSTHTYSNKLLLFSRIYDSGYFLDMSIYNTDGEILSTMEAPSNSVSLNNIIYLNDNILIQMYDESYLYLIYYSSISNSFSYRSFSKNFFTTINSYGGSKEGNIQNITNDSILCIVVGESLGYTNETYFSNYISFLPIFNSDTSLSDEYNFAVDETMGYTPGFKRNNTDDIWILVNNGVSNNFENLQFNSNSGLGYTYSFITTDINTDQFISNSWDLESRNIIRWSDDVVGHYDFITSTGSIISGMTYSLDLSSIIEKSARNSMFVSTNGGSVSNSYYSNTSTGNQFVSIDEYYDDYQQEYGFTNDSRLYTGNILIYNLESKLCRIITDTSISSTFSMNLMNTELSSKYLFECGKEFVSIKQTREQTPSLVYTHTSLGSNGPINPIDYIMDGIINTSPELSESFFGTGSSYFTNLYPGLFVMVADNISISNFSIDGGLGADGSGQTDEYQYTNGGYTIYVKRVWDTGDPSVNHIIIVPSDGTGITHNVSTDTNNDYDSLSGLNSINRIHYLLTSKASGGYLTNIEIENIVNEYIQIVDGLSLNDILTALNSDYQNVTDQIEQPLDWNSNVSGLYYFSDEGTNSSIGDGGNDMYDGGNHIRTTLISVGDVDNSVVKLSYFDLDGNLINSISDDTYSLDTGDLRGIIATGFIGNGFFKFNGTTVDFVEVDGIDDYFYNDWIWYD